ncbi:MAG: hypothetical protein D6732_11505 [Methanobacteriota archaeon]|nr:MAG: hypothetical protein D6732_11505 [Euryarchaeota archaeon]
MKLNIFRSKEQQEKVSLLDEPFGFSSVEEVLKSAKLDFTSFLRFHDFDQKLIFNPWLLKLQKSSPSLFSICSFSTSDPSYHHLLFISNSLSQNFRFRLIEYCKARMIATKSMTEIGFILDFLSQLQPKRAIEAVFDVLDDLATAISILQESESLFMNGFPPFEANDRIQSILQLFEHRTPAESILRLRKQIFLLIESIELDLLPTIIQYDYDAVENILTFSSRLIHTTFKSVLKHTHTFQLKLLRLFGLVIDLLEPFDSGYISQSFRIELMEHLNQYLSTILESLQDRRIEHNEYLAKLLMPYDAALEFNLKLRNALIEDLALNTTKTDTVLEQFINLAISIGIWSHPDFQLNRAGQQALEEFNWIYFKLLNLEALQPFLLTEILLRNFIHCEFKLPYYLRSYLLKIPPEQTEEIADLWEFIVHLLEIDNY